MKVIFTPPIYLLINLDKFHGFPNHENIWDLSDPNIPPMYTDGNPEIQRAEIQVNIDFFC